MNDLTRLEKAILAIKNLNNKLDTFSQPIAIIGMSGTFPGAQNLEAFWDLLKHGKDGVQTVPNERWSKDDYFDEDPKTPGKIVTDRGGFIEQVDLFDAHFFNISPREAEYLDPQQRLLLEKSWEALEHAGIAPLSLKKSNTGVFIGIGTHDYYSLWQQYSKPEQINAYLGTGTALSAASGRLSYFLGLQGPSMAIETACSSSLVALHEACKALQRSECSLALVGGVNVILTPDVSIVFSKAGMLAPDGKCKTFDEKADGYVRGEGCGIIVVKRLADAIREGDNILAVIKASGINQDGASSGLTVPNGKAQKDLLKKVLSESKLTVENIDYIECHGTGTSLGDPIEVEAIGQVYGKDRSKPLKLGSVKTNIGHLETAAGVAGVIKTVLALQHREIPKNLHFQRLNPHIDLNFSAEIVAKHEAWERNSSLRCAAVSAFGFSGTNAHIILEEAPELPPRDGSIKLPQEQVFVISAKCRRSLEHLIQHYVAYLQQNEEASLADICYTAAVGRSHFNYRIALIVSSQTDLLEQLKGQLDIAEVQIVSEVVEVSSSKDLAKAYLAGKTIDWQSYYQPYIKALRKIVLPTYVFDKKRYWLDIKPSKALPFGETIHELLGVKLPGFAEDTRFINRLTLNDLPYLSEHQVFNHIIFPAAGFIETALSSQVLFEPNPVLLQEINFIAPLKLSSAKAVDYQVRFVGNQGTIHSQQQDNWIEHVRFNLEHTVHRHEVIDIEALKASMKPVALDAFYEHYNELGLNYGLAFQTVNSAYRQDQDVFVQVKIQDDITIKNYSIHPTLLDGIFQAAALLVNNKNTCIPAFIKKLYYFNHSSKELWAKLTLISQNEQSATIDINIYDASGVLVAIIDGFVVRVIAQQAFEKLLVYGKALGGYIEDYRPYELPVFNKEGLEIVVYSSARAYKNLDFKAAIQGKVAIEQDLTNKAIVFIYEDNLDTLITLAQHISTARPDSFTIIINQGFAVHEHDEVNPLHSQVIGFFRSFVQENTSLRAYLIDTPYLKAIHSVLTLIGQQALTENQVIVREQIYVPRLVTLDEYNKTHQSLNVKNSTFNYDVNATYLITGGTGGLGLELSNYLISQGVKHLALTSRRPLSEEVKAWIASQQAQGINIEHYAVDIADKKALKEVFVSIAKQTYPLKGIFHAAGVLKDGLLINLTLADFDTVFAPKVQGAQNLHELSHALELDCFVLFSSIASALGSAGQSNYAAANAYMDGLAKYRRQQGLPALSINFGPFAKVGMAAHLQSQHHAQGLHALVATTAFMSMQRLFNQHYAQVTIAQIDWQKVPFQNSLYLDQLVTQKQTNQNDWLGLLEATTTDKRHALLSHRLQALLAEILNISNLDGINVSQDFFDLGMDSLMAVDFQNKIQQLVGKSTKLPNTLVFDYNNITVLTDYLLAQLSEQVKPDIRSKNNVNDKNNAEGFSLIKAPSQSLIIAGENQKRLVSLTQLYPINYNLGIILKINDSLDVVKLNKIIYEITEKNLIYKVNYLYADELYQWIKYDRKINVENIKFTESVLEELKNLIYTPYDLFKDNLIRFAISTTNNNETYFLAACHHSITDLISMSVLVKDIFEAYYNNKDISLNDNITYFDYCVSCDQFFKSEQYHTVAKYWREKFIDLEKSTSIRPDLSNNLKQLEVKNKDFKAPRKLVDMIKSYSSSNNQTIFNILYASFILFMGKITASNDILIGLAVHGREVINSLNIHGFFTKVLPARFKIPKEQRFNDFLVIINQALMEDNKNQPVSIKDLYDEISKEKINNIFDIVFNYNSATSYFNKSNIEIVYSEVANANSNLAFLWNKNSEDDYSLQIKYNHYNYSENYIDCLANQYLELICSLISKPDLNVFEHSIVTKKDMEIISKASKGNTQNDYFKKTYVNYLNELMVVYANNIIIHENDMSYTYKDLANRSDKLCEFILNTYPDKSEAICILMNRGIDLISAMIGILKAGHPFVLLNPELPHERLQYIIKDSHALAVLSNRKTGVNQNLPKITYIEDIEPTFISAKNKINRNDIAYICYTSGTTGKPKGVIINQSGLLNMSKNYEKIFNLSEKIVSGQYSSISFDAFIGEVFPALISCSPIVIIPEEIKTDIHALSDYINQYNINHMFLPTAIYYLMSNKELSSLKTLIVAGEKLEHIAETTYKIINAYGPTENTVCTTLKEIHANEKITIGRPIDNVDVYILDKQLAVCPIGVPGELYISGKSLANGYMNLEDKTQEAFIPNPYLKNSKLYKTGDICRFLPNGDIEYIGRNDFQVKIRGIRIELEEIDSVIYANEEIKFAASIVKANERGDNEIITFIQPIESIIDKLIDDELFKSSWINDLKISIQHKLPSYMVPVHIELVTNMQLTSNGKINREQFVNYKLPDYRLIRSQKPFTITQKKLAEIWMNVLKLSEVGIDDDYFNLGGHSINVSELKSQILSEFNKEISLMDLYKHSTIRSQEYLITQDELQSQDETLVKLTNKSGQANLFLIHPIGGEVSCYLDLAKKLEGKYTIYALQYSDKNQYKTIRQMANYYLNKILSIQPNGKYHIGGWSMGGIIAYDIGILLNQQNVSDVNVLMIDSYLPGYFDFKSQFNNTNIDEKIALKILLEDLGSKVDIESRSLENIDLNSMEKLTSKLLSENKISKIEHQLLNNLINRYMLNIEAIKNYSPQSYNGVLSYIICTENTQYNIQVNASIVSEFWQQRTLNNKINIYEIKTNHIGVLKHPDIADRVNYILLAT